MSNKETLTRWDLALLDRHLSFYLSLAEQSRQATTPLQAHFVAVAMGSERPMTQHEVAFDRYRAGWLDPSLAPRRKSPIVRVTRPTLRVERTVDWVDTARLRYSTEAIESTLRGINRLYATGRAGATRASSDAAAWVATAMADVDIQGGLAEWTSEEFGRLSNIYTKAIDGEFIKGLVPGTDYVSPWLHRLFEGHTPIAAWAAVKNAMPDDTLAEEFFGYVKALGSDLVTKIGLPVTTLTPDQFQLLDDILCKSLGMSMNSLIDQLHVNAVEVAGAAVPIAVAAMRWNKTDGEAFARLVGSLGIGAAIAGNPLMALVAVAMLAKAFNDVRHERELVRGVLSGGVTSGGILFTSALVGGPAWLGLAAGIGIAIGIKQAAKSTNSLYTMAPRQTAEKLSTWLTMVRDAARPI